MNDRRTVKCSIYVRHVLWSRSFTAGGHRIPRIRFDSRLLLELWTLEWGVPDQLKAGHLGVLLLEVDLVMGSQLLRACRKEGGICGPRSWGFAPQELGRESLTQDLPSALNIQGTVANKKQFITWPLGKSQKLLSRASFSKHSRCRNGVAPSHSSSMCSLERSFASSQPICIPQSPSFTHKRLELRPLQTAEELQVQSDFWHIVMS